MAKYKLRQAVASSAVLAGFMLGLEALANPGADELNERVEACAEQLGENAVKKVALPDECIRYADDFPYHQTIVRIGTGIPSEGRYNEQEEVTLHDLPSRAAFLEEERIDVADYENDRNLRRFIGIPLGSLLIGTVGTLCLQVSFSGEPIGRREGSADDIQQAQ